MHLSRRYLALVLTLGLTPCFASAANPKVDFARDIQPIFARRCYKCHGPNANKGGLRLNTQRAAISKLESGERAVVPGKPKLSAIVNRISSGDSSERMPPTGKPLTKKEQSLIRQWIKAGASWSSHWAFDKLSRPAIPQTKKAGWARNPIDHFVLKRLEEAKLSPAKPADKVALLRRAYYDLIGLPPTPEQVDKFVADKSGKAFERVIDELLRSPHYGEKWARHWLDLVRYAETNGYERDSRKDLIWKYRDYVIRAFNSDKPYDRFVMEQLAGDELPDRNGDSITATGFYRLGIWDDDPADRLLARFDYLDDILRTTGETFLAMTIGCARCHDHKIDPIAQKDYYSMLSFFADVSPHGGGRTNHVKIDVAASKVAFEKKRKAKQDLEAKLSVEISRWEKEFLAKLKQKYPRLKVKPTKPAGGTNVSVAPDSIRQGQAWRYTTQRPPKNWFQLAFNDRKWKTGKGGFGTKGTPGSVVRTTWNNRNIWLRQHFRLTEIPARLFLNIHHDEDAQVYLNGKRIASLRGYVTKYKRIDVTSLAAEVLQTGRNTLAIHCRQTGGGQYIDAGLYGDFSMTTTLGLAKKYGKELMGAARLAAWHQIRQRLQRSQASKLTRKTEFVMAVAERGRQKTYVLGRGNPRVRGEQVGPAFPQVLQPPPATIPQKYVRRSTTGRRRVLAEWIVSDKNPLAARVAVNRIWQHHFGRGIARSSSDFGFQGRPPTHPQLLDWLATEFVKRGWKMKSLHKLIMMSATYQMSSRADAKALAQDPTNNLMWRFNMRRLTAEEIRDSVLAVTGKLNRKMFGASVYPPLPSEVLATSSTPNRVWGRSSPADASRRSIYIHVKRSLRPPMLVNFDSPDVDSACAVRVSTTVPTQALGMLNSRFINQQAANLASRVFKEHPGDLQSQVRRAIRLTTGRAPRGAEVREDVRFVQMFMKTFKLPARAAFKQYALLALNTNEFVYLD